MADKQTWEQLAAADPAAIAGRTGASGDGITFPFLTGTVTLHPADASITAADGPLAGGFIKKFDVPLLSYCLEGDPVSPAGDWVSPKELPGGYQFFLGGSHNIPSDPVLNRYGNDRDGFETACRAFGGTSLSFGDVSFRIPVLDQVPVAVVLWEGDDEFEPRVSLLVDRSAGERLPLDALLGLLLLTAVGLAAYSPEKHDE